MIAFSIYSVSNFQICNIVLLTLVTSLCIILLRTAAGWASLSFTISRSLLRLMPIDLVMPSNHLILCCPLLLLPSASGSFPVNSLFASGGQSIEASASTSVLPVNIQGWFPFGLTGLFSLPSKELSSVFSSTTIQKHLYLVLSLLYSPTLTSVHDYWRNYNFFYMDLVSKVMSLLFNTLSRFSCRFF